MSVLFTGSYQRRQDQQCECKTKRPTSNKGNSTSNNQSSCRSHKLTCCIKEVPGGRQWQGKEQRDRRSTGKTSMVSSYSEQQRSGGGGYYASRI